MGVWRVSSAVPTPPDAHSSDPDGPQRACTSVTNARLWGSESPSDVRTSASGDPQYLGRLRLVRRRQLFFGMNAPLRPMNCTLRRHHGSAGGLGVVSDLDPGGWAGDGERARARAHTHTHPLTRTLTQTHSHSRAHDRTRAHMRLREVARRGVVRVFGGGGGRRETPSSGVCTTPQSTHAHLPRCMWASVVMCAMARPWPALPRRHGMTSSAVCRACAGGWRQRSACRTARGKGHRARGRGALDGGAPRWDSAAAWPARGCTAAHAPWPLPSPRRMPVGRRAW